MKFTMLMMLTGLLVLSCKKEVRTERSVNTDTIITDTIVRDTGTTVAPMPPPVDTIHHKDDVSDIREKDTAKVPQSRTSKK